jgi:hypothetical protein
MFVQNKETEENLELWRFAFEKENNNSTSSKDLKKIRSEIGDVMRQVLSTVTFLPQLECVCKFGIGIVRTNKDSKVPGEWIDFNDHIDDVEKVQLRAFSTGLHKTQTSVSYKKESDDAS